MRPDNSNTAARIVPSQTHCPQCRRETCSYGKTLVTPPPPESKPRQSGATKPSSVYTGVDGFSSCRDNANVESYTVTYRIGAFRLIRESGHRIDHLHAKDIRKGKGRVLSEQPTQGSNVSPGSSGNRSARQRDVARPSSDKRIPG